MTAWCCACGREFTTKGWRTRHRRKCPVWLNTPEAQLTLITIRAHLPEIVRNLTDTSPLLQRLLKKGDRHE